MKEMEPLRTHGCQDALQQALTAAGEWLGLEEFHCAGAKGDFGKERHDKRCDCGATALGTRVVAPTLGCKVLVSTLLQATEELWGQQCFNASLIPKENPKLKLDLATM